MSRIHPHKIAGPHIPPHNHRSRQQDEPPKANMGGVNRSLDLTEGHMNDVKVDDIVLRERVCLNMTGQQTC